MRLFTLPPAITLAKWLGQLSEETDMAVRTRKVGEKYQVFRGGKWVPETKADTKRRIARNKRISQRRKKARRERRAAQDFMLQHHDKTLPPPPPLADDDRAGSSAFDNPSAITQRKHIHYIICREKVDVLINGVRSQTIYDVPEGQAVAAAYQKVALDTGAFDVTIVEGRAPFKL